ncbi:MAG: alpha/beta hydrolase [Pyrinomonadaceae bacterium]|nr:alpha/beta hydrolase [Pyrinomonadaceae bacterium]
MNKKNLALGIGGAIGVIVGVKLLTRASTVKWEAVSDKIQHAENSHFIEVDGATVHFQEFGERMNPTLLLIHGYTASTYVWKTVAPMLAAQKFHVIAVDLIGFGYSDKPAWFEYTITAQARVIERFMNRLGIGKAIIIGSSYGGAVAATLALDYAERVEKLVLVGAVSNDEVLDNPLLKLASVPLIGEIFTPFLLDSKQLSKARMKQTFAPESQHLITKERIESVMRPLKAKDAHHSVLTSARQWDANRIQTDAHLISQPTLLIWGEDDVIIPLHNGENLYDSILNSRLIILKNCGHLPPEEKPDRFVALVGEFSRDRKSHIHAAENERLNA